MVMEPSSSFSRLANCKLAALGVKPATVVVAVASRQHPVATWLEFDPSCWFLTGRALRCSVQIVTGRDPSIQAASRPARAPAWTWWTGGTVLAVAALMWCYLRIAGTTRVNSDAAGSALQGWDMLHGNVLLHGWWTTDFSLWTTELPQYALVSAVAGLRPEVVHICAALTYTLLVLLAAFAARGRATGAEAVGRALLAAVILLAPEPGQGAYLTLFEPDHVGTAVPVLAVLLLLDLAPRRWWVPVLTAVMLTWGLLGDPLYLVAAVIPLAALLVTRVALALRRGGTLRGLWFEFSLAAAAVLAMAGALATSKLVTALGGFNVQPLTQWSRSGPLAGITYDVRGVLALFGADPGNFSNQWDTVPGGIPAHLQSGPETAFALIHLLGVAVVIAAVAVAGRRLFRTLASPAMAPEDLVPGLMVAMIVVNLAVFFAVYYRAGDVFVGREAGPVLALAATLAGRQFGGPLARAVLGATAGRARALLRGSLAAVVACYCAMLGYAAAQPQVPPASASLAGWLAEHNLREGLGLYWAATSVTLDSGGAITVAPVARNRGSARLGPLRWEADMRLSDPARHRANFLVLADDPDVTSQHAMETFGRPAKTYRYQAYTILVWPENLLRYLGKPVM